jgi:hypothetical protein
MLVVVAVRVTRTHTQAVWAAMVVAVMAHKQALVWVYQAQQIRVVVVVVLTKLRLLAVLAVLA